MPTSVTVRVPSTSANLGPGFDCLGLALDLWATITVSSGAEGDERDPMVNMALVAARRVFEKAGHEPDGGVSAHYEGDIPIARGLGASAIARIGGVVAGNVLAGDPLDRERLLMIATDLEGHADNVAPALFGGFQVSVAGPERVLHTAVPLPLAFSPSCSCPSCGCPRAKAGSYCPRTCRGLTLSTTPRAPRFSSRRWPGALRPPRRRDAGHAAPARALATLPGDVRDLRRSARRRRALRLPFRRRLYDLRLRDRQRGRASADAMLEAAGAPRNARPHDHHAPHREGRRDRRQT